MTDLTGARLGDFEIVRELGRGGMGIVYEARQVSLNRKVALKVLSGGLGLTPKTVQRFQREAEAAARLHHTNIVPVYATGEENGAHYYAMELIDGPSLDHVIKQMRRQTAEADPAPELGATGPYVGDATLAAPGSHSSSLGSGSGYFDTAARMVAEVADALDYAHKQGVIHRDIKPSNLLLSPVGRLSINDFGLARVLEQPGMTLTGEFVGTPLYMSPEQITAGRAPLDHRTDIYSLGAALYELLTLQPPFAAQRRDQVIAQIIHKEPKAPRQVNRKVPVDLETICLKAMDKDPDRRYQTGKDMADDLRRYVNRFAIAARRAGPWARLKKWAKRHPAVAALLGCLAVAVLVAGFFADQAKQDRDRLRAEQQEAAVQKAILEAMSGDPPAALQAIAEAESKGAEPGRLNMLRGLVEVHRGRPEEAIVYLEQADRQLPDCVAVKGLLASAYGDSGQLQRGDEMIVLVSHLEPKTAEDHLFLGLFQAGLDPALGLRTLDGAPARARQPPIARLGRAMTQTQLAMMTGRVEDAERALDDLGKVDLPDNPLLLGTRVRAHLVAAHAYGPNDARGDAVLDQAARDAKRLEAHLHNPIAVQARCYYLLVRDHDNDLLDVAHQAGEKHVENPYVTDMEASVLYRQKKFKEARKVVKAAPNVGGFQLIEQGIVLAALPEGKAEAETAFRDAINGSKGGDMMSCLVAGYLQLLGPEYRAQSRKASREISDQWSGLIPNWRDGWYRHLLAFHAGLIDAKDDAKELLKRAGNSQFNLCEAYFYIGLARLAEGRRAEAKECFRSSLDTGVFTFYEYSWSRAFLARIDDPDWPPWVPPNK
jgi:tetratricopeptide (TPR) repeat protein